MILVAHWLDRSVCDSLIISRSCSGLAVWSRWLFRKLIQFFAAAVLIVSIALNVGVYSALGALFWWLAGWSTDEVTSINVLFTCPVEEPGPQAETRLGRVSMLSTDCKTDSLQIDGTKAGQISCPAEAAVSKGLRRTLFGKSRVRRTREQCWQSVRPSRRPPSVT